MTDMAWIPLGRFHIPRSAGEYQDGPGTCSVEYHRRGDGLVRARVYNHGATHQTLAFFVAEPRHHTGFAYVAGCNDTGGDYRTDVQLNPWWWLYSAAVYYRDHLAQPASLEDLVRAAWTT